jgi:hypothetical protein
MALYRICASASCVRLQAVAVYRTRGSTSNLWRYTEPMALYRTCVSTPPAASATALPVEATTPATSTCTVDIAVTVAVEVTVEVAVAVAVAPKVGIEIGAAVAMQAAVAHQHEHVLSVIVRHVVCVGGQGWVECFSTLVLRTTASESLIRKLELATAVPVQALVYIGNVTHTH